MGRRVRSRREFERAEGGTRAILNLNDEAAALSTLENSYQAASQVFTILNRVMTSALNLGEETAVA
jgi:flagellar hook-associated protein 1